MRELKFRAWCEKPGSDTRFFYFFSVGHSVPAEYSVVAWSQFTDIKDKDGAELFFDDLVRIKSRMGEKAEWLTDAIYRICRGDLGGIELRFQKLAWEDEDKNQIPINQTLCEKYDSLTLDFRNRNYDKLAVPDTWGSNHHFGTRWQNNHYTNDIVLVGNAFQNPELLRS